MQINWGQPLPPPPPSNVKDARFRALYDASHRALIRDMGVLNDLLQRARTQEQRDQVQAMIDQRHRQANAEMNHILTRYANTSRI